MKRERSSKPPPTRTVECVRCGAILAAAKVHLVVTVHVETYDREGETRTVERRNLCGRCAELEPAHDAKTCAGCRR